jgi:hypothetical protein
MTMTKFRVICPNCGIGVVTETPKALVWELCPGCRHYVWDLSDALMAEIVPTKSKKSESLITSNQ